MKHEVNKTISVWLAMKDGPNKGKFVLQRRSASEKSFPFVLQSTWSGGVELGEEVIDAIKRECREELGDGFCSNFDFLSLRFFGKSEFFRKLKNSIWECQHYEGEISEGILKLAKLHKDAFLNFIYIGKDDKFSSLAAGGDPQKNIILFDDQYEIFKKLLNKNGN